MEVIFVMISIHYKIHLLTDCETLHIYSVCDKGGGYDFPGSNSGIDLFALSGWIPEQIYFPENLSNIKDYETTPDRAWARLLSAHSYGDLLATVSCSDNLSSDKADEMGLITGHAYAVLNVANINGIKMLQIKNPWARKVMSRFDNSFVGNMYHVYMFHLTGCFWY